MVGPTDLELILNWFSKQTFSLTSAASMSPRPFGTVMVFSQCTGRDITTHRSAPAAGVWYEQLRTVWVTTKVLLPTHPATGNNTELSGECLYYNPYLPGQYAMARPPS